MHAPKSTCSSVPPGGRSDPGPADSPEGILAGIPASVSDPKSDPESPLAPKSDPESPLAPKGAPSKLSPVPEAVARIPPPSSIRIEAPIAPAQNSLLSISPLFLSSDIIMEYVLFWTFDSVRVFPRYGICDIQALILIYLHFLKIDSIFSTFELTLIIS